MACFQYEVEFAALKGLGPDEVTVFIPVAFDDIDDEMPELIVIDWAVGEARAEMKRRGFIRYSLREVHNA